MYNFISQLTAIQPIGYGLLVNNICKTGKLTFNDNVFMFLHRALQKFFHTALQEMAISGHLFRYKVEIYLGLYEKFRPTTYYPSLHFLCHRHIIFNISFELSHEKFRTMILYDWKIGLTYKDCHARLVQAWGEQRTFPPHNL